MGPHNDDFMNDPTFQHLLISQREHLSRLHSQQLREEMTIPTSVQYSTLATNHSIGFETFRNDNIAPSKRLSIGVGADDLIMPDQKFEFDPCIVQFLDDVAKKDGKGSYQANPLKRRRSSSSFNKIFDQVTELRIFPEPAPKRARNRVEYNDSDDDEYGVIMEDAASDDDDDFDQDAALLEFNPRKAKSLLVMFDKSMRKSQESQQKIHDWDRQMGLKRSHSKTMRLSSRSRKQLRQFTQNDIMNLSSWL